MADNETGKSTEGHRAGLFDIRVIIAALLGIYGVILVVTSFFTSDSQLQRDDDLNVNLTAGIGMIVVAVGFVIWTRWRPIIVPETVETEDTPG
jgi:hypothetical protein